MIKTKKERQLKAENKELKQRLKENYKSHQELKKAYEKVCGAYCLTLEIDY